MNAAEMAEVFEFRAGAAGPFPYDTFWRWFNAYHRTLLRRYRTWIVPDWKRLDAGERHETVVWR